MAAVSVQFHPRPVLVSRTRLALALVLLGWLVVFVCAVLGGGGASGASADGTVLSAGRTHTVVAGETLWSIAADAGRDDTGRGAGDPRAVVHEIAALNHLSGSGVRPGQVLVLP